MAFQQDEGQWETWPNGLADDGEWQTVSYKKRRSKSSLASSVISSEENKSEVSCGVEENGGGDAEQKKTKRKKKEATQISTTVDAAAKFPAAENRPNLVKIKGTPEPAVSSTSASYRKKVQWWPSDFDDEDKWQTGSYNKSRISSKENKTEVSSGVGNTVPKKDKGEKKKKSVPAKLQVAQIRSTLAEIENACKRRHDAQLRRLVNVFERFFTRDDSSQFLPWLKFLGETMLNKTIDVPLSHIRRDVLEIVSDWIAQRNPEVLGSLVLACLDNIYSDIAIHDAAIGDSEKSEISTSIVLAMILRRRPDLLIGLLPTLSQNQKYQEQEKLPMMVWIIAQASQTDTFIGLYSWVHILLPALNCNSDFSSSQCRDLILQLAERMLSSPKALNVLKSHSINKDELMPLQSALVKLLRFAFPRSSAKVKETERFRAVYLALKDVVLTGSLKGKEMKRVTEQMLSDALKAAGEGVRDLSNEASNVIIWCLAKNPDCFKQWDKLYLNNLKASVLVLRKISENATEFPAADKLLKQTLRSLTHKNQKALEKPVEYQEALLEDSNYYCREILGEYSQSPRCGFTKNLIMVAVAVVLGAAAMSKDVLHWKF